MSYRNGGEKMGMVATKPCRSHLEGQLKKEISSCKVDQKMIDAIDTFSNKNGEHTIHEMGLYRVYGEIMMNMIRTQKRIDKLTIDIELAED